MAIATPTPTSPLKEPNRRPSDRPRGTPVTCSSKTQPTPGHGVEPTQDAWTGAGVSPSNAIPSNHPIDVGSTDGGWDGSAMERLATASEDENEYGGLTPKATSTTGLNDGTGSGRLS